MPTYTYTDQDNRPDMIPAGIYRGSIVSAEEVIAKSSGNEMISLTWEVDGNHALIYDNLVFTEKAAWKIDTLLKATGHAPANKGDEIELNADDMIGWAAPLNVGVDKYVDGAGNEREKNVIVQYVTNKPEVVEPTVVDPKDDLPFG